MTRTLLAVATALAVLNPIAAQAHDTYLLPQVFVFETADAPVALTSAEKFPNLEYGPKKARVQRLEVRGETTSATLTIAAETKTELQLTLRNGRGFQVAGVALSPHDIQLTLDKVAEYFEEIGASADVRRAYDALPEPRAWNERYTKYAKTIICMAPCKGDGAASKPVGFAFEFVAQPHSGSARSFQLLRHGLPVARQPVAITDDRGTRQLTTTNSEGVLQIATPGTYLLSAVIIDPPEGPGGRFTSDFATLTFALTKDGKFAGAE